jgi:hypothetical protein
MGRGASNKIGFAILTLSALAAVIVGAWWLTRSTTPQGLFQMTLDFYEDAPHLNPFEDDYPPHPSLLEGVSIETARAALSQCDFPEWRYLGASEQIYRDDALYHHWECRADSVLVRAKEMWEPYMGIDGVQFAACLDSSCPEFEQSFDRASYVRSTPTLVE